MQTQTLIGPSQVRYPAKAVLRTLVQVLITIVTVVPWIVSAVDDAAQGSPFAAQLSAAGAQALVVAGVITRFMAVPGVNAALTKWGLGARPAGAPAVVLQAPQIPQDAPTPEVVGALPDQLPDPPAADSRPYGRHARLDPPDA